MYYVQILSSKNGTPLKHFTDHIEQFPCTYKYNKCLNKHTKVFINRQVVLKWSDVRREAGHHGKRTELHFTTIKEGVGLMP